ncbi:transmembrane protein [Anaeramoeba ignava]|uniref:Transmembrane protein n=1 Tax=Anaeramoeba ignava TaxID=1746090 RepID=A0A9Q0LC93_ANAIG|nr:transmembrane protein [Anaeramoeba ignava]
MGIIFALLRDYFYPFLVFLLMLMTFLIPPAIKPKQKDFDEMNMHYPENSSTGSLDNTIDRLFWFVQISDLHLNKFKENFGSQFERVCTNYIGSINPKFVILSGDITDARESDDYPVRNKQNIEEWEKYQEILNNCGVNNSSFWFDIRGNHDNAAVLKKYASDNYFYDYSPQSPFLNSLDRPSMYSFVHQEPYGSYQFVGMDLGTYPLISGPLGFFMFVDKDKLDELEENFEFNKNNYDINQTIVFTHSPLTTVQRPLTKSSSGKNLDKILKDNRVLSVLDGHFHNKEMYSRLFSKKDTIFDLQVNDVKSDGAIRIFAIDNDLFSFTDTDTTDKDDPIIVITNPKDSRFISQKEPLYKIKQSTFIRVLIFHSSTFDPLRISTVSCDIDGETISYSMTRVNPTEPLWVAAWNPNDYSDGVHEITITIKDLGGNEVITQTQDFSVDKTPSFIGYNFFEIVQRHNLYSFMVGWDVVLIFIYVIQFGTLPKIIKKIMKRTPTKFEMFSEQFEDKTTKITFLSFFGYTYKSMIWKFSMIPTFKWILICTVGWLFVFGPNFAEFTDGKWGASFMFGVAFDGSKHLYSTMFWYAMVGFGGIFLPTLIMISLPVIEPPRSSNYKLRLLIHPETLIALTGVIGFLEYFSYDLWSGYKGSSLILSFGLWWPTMICFALIVTTIIQDYRKIIKLKREEQSGDSENSYINNDIEKGQSNPNSQNSVQYADLTKDLN